LEQRTASVSARNLRTSWVDRHAALVAVCATLASVVILVATVLVLKAGRHEAIDRARNTSANVASALARDMARNLEIYDLSLQAVVDGMTDPAVLSLPVEIRHQVLFDRSTTAAYISGIYALDARGRISQARARQLPDADFSDRDYFSVHRDRSDVGLFISKPYLSRLRDGTPSIALSRRIPGADGGFAGVAFIAINLGYFQQLVDDVKLGHQGAATIVQTDGFIVARNPRLAGTAANIRSSPTFPKMMTAQSGSYDARSPIDGVEKIFTYSHVRGSNLIVVVAPAIEDVTAEWKHRSLIIGTLVIVVSAGFTAVVWLLVFAVRQRDAAQAKLVEIAGTDGLTGVANRRRLDSALDELWADALHTGASVGILFADADHFKAYNDTHGHETGDRALRYIADCLRRHAKRKGDLVARYGGEEFVVVLADVTAARTREVAEAIRADVAKPAAAAATTATWPDLPAVTVSIGFVACRPADGRELDDVMRLADQALYRSKAQGRNRVTEGTPDVRLHGNAGVET
jgi:diguanylate cyclase (GGDEF)-like protein